MRIVPFLALYLSLSLTLSLSLSLVDKILARWSAIDWSMCYQTSLGIQPFFWKNFCNFLTALVTDSVAQLPLTPSSAAISRNFFFSVYRAWSRRADDAPSGPGNDEPEAQQGNGSGIINQEEIQHDIDAVDNDPHPHGRLGVARGPEDGAEQDRGRPEQHGQVKDEKVSPGQLSDGGVNLHPYGDHAADGGTDNGGEDTRNQNHQGGLSRRFFAASRSPAPQALAISARKPTPKAEKVLPTNHAMVLVAPTAAVAWVPREPTMAVSMYWTAVCMTCSTMVGQASVMIVAAVVQAACCLSLRFT